MEQPKKWAGIKGGRKLFSCKIRFLKDKKKAWPGEPYCIENLEKKFSKQVMMFESPKMPKI